ncbi:heavy metal translocating P-type ATPase [Pigmentiphaga litoralis]|uniref:heavy metal translocating P-type ATPase n=1 Tax=Pigmentiphaga litoralis TaxID=516702 RepID=UPI003B43A017
MSDSKGCCGSAQAQAHARAAAHAHAGAHAHAHADAHAHAHADAHAHAQDTCCAAGPEDLAASVAAQPAPDGTPFSLFRIDQMDCPTEERLLRKALEPLPGVHQLAFNLIERTLRVHHDLPDPEPLMATIRGLDMKPVLLNAPGQEGAAPAAPAPAVSRTMAWRMGIAGVLAIGSEVVAFSTGDETSWPIAALALAAILIGGLPTLRKGWIALKNLTLNINLLMTVAVIGAVLIGQWPEAAVVIWLFGIAEMIEALSLERARNAIRGLTALAPDRALVRQPDGGWLEQSVDTLAIGQVVRVRPGERVVLDGVVLRGVSSIDQSPITGESMPVDKQTGDRVFAGTINQDGVLEIDITTRKGDTMLDRIARSVQDAQAQRAPTQRFIDRFARIYTPIVFLAAIAVAVVAPLAFGAPWQPWIYRALVLLVIACPCALVISTPVTIVSGLTAAARRGILVKGGLYLEQGRKLTALALDKTGTLTEGKPTLTDIMVLPEDNADSASGTAPTSGASLGSGPGAPLHSTAALSRDAAHRLAASIDVLSPHPVAVAIASGVNAADLAEVTGFQSLPGRGVQGAIDGVMYYVGNPRLMQEIGADTPAVASAMEALERQGKTAVVLARKGQALALLAVADTVRDTSRQAIADLNALGVRTVMLSGDNAATVSAVGTSLDITDARGNLLPEDKLRIVNDLSNQGRVGMVGDGVNDAPALARADIGFAMGAAGTDTAIETADVALMQDDLRKIPEFIRLSRRTAAVLMQNIAFALLLKIVFFGLTFTGHATLWMAVFADAGGSLLVVFNGLRLLRTPHEARTTPAPVGKPATA